MIGTAKEAIDEQRRKGRKVGLLNLRVFRPFPIEEIRKILRNVRVVAVMDRSISYASTGGPIYHEISSALNNLSDRPLTIDFVLGLGGRDVTRKTIDKIVDQTEEASKAHRVTKELFWPDAREEVLKNWGEWVC